MPRLCIDLQEGFTGEPITITINSKAIYQKQPKTRNQIGLAESIEVDHSDPLARIMIESPKSGQTGSFEIRSDVDVYLGVNRGPDGSFEFTPSNEPFHYL